MKECFQRETSLGNLGRSCSIATDLSLKYVAKAVYMKNSAKPRNSARDSSLCILMDAFPSWVRRITGSSWSVRECWCRGRSFCSSNPAAQFRRVATDSVRRIGDFDEKYDRDTHHLAMSHRHACTTSSNNILDGQQQPEDTCLCHVMPFVDVRH